MSQEVSSKIGYDSLIAWISKLPEVTHAPHRFGEIEFQVMGLEFMHFHGQRQLDLRLSKRDQEQVLGEGKAEQHLFAPQAGWVTFRVRREDDFERAKDLITLAYNNARQIIAEHASRTRSIIA